MRNRQMVVKETNCLVMSLWIPKGNKSDPSTRFSGNCLSLGYLKISDSNGYEMRDFIGCDRLFMLIFFFVTYLANANIPHLLIYRIG